MTRDKKDRKCCQLKQPWLRVVSNLGSANIILSIQLSSHLLSWSLVICKERDSPVSYSALSSKTGLNVTSRLESWNHINHRLIPEYLSVSRLFCNDRGCNGVLSLRSAVCVHVWLPLLVFDSSALDSLQCLGRHCVTCVAESEAGSSLAVCLPTGILSTCLYAKKTQVLGGFHSSSSSDSSGTSDSELSGLSTVL